MDTVQRFRRSGLLAILVAGVFAAAAGSWSCSEKTSPITIGTTTSEVNSLIHIAQDMGYFNANGLDVTIQVYASGNAAIQGILNGEADMATASEFAFAGKVLSKEDIRIIGVINRSSVEYLVARKDRGINAISDLKGKRIGVPMRSRPEFALGRLLFLRGIDVSDVTMANVSPAQAVNAIVNGEVDAVSIWQPYVYRIQDRLADEVIVWSAQNAQASYNGVVATDKWTAEHPDLIRRVLKSLIQAETYNASNPEEARAIIRQKLDYSEEYMAAVWPDYQFSVSLDQSLVAAMEDEARWMMSNSLTAEKQVPNFPDYIYDEGLKAIRPGSVGIIR